jgi:LPPG:FO 2-phospho-L-lactate transferase
VTRGVVGIGGGIGASRFWRALLRVLEPAELTLVVNTGDDLWLHGLRICPDLDTTLYALSGRQDVRRGWGLSGETFRCMDALRDLGQEVWFNLGDRDLATHLLRTGLLGDGASLSEVTAVLAQAMGVGVRVLPMTDDMVTTHVVTTAGAVLHYEEFLVRHQAAPEVAEVRYTGAGRAVPAPGVLAAIADAGLVVIAPSNPLASIGPVLAVPGIRAALRAAAAPVLAVTPIVSRVPISDPGERVRAASRAQLLAARGLAPTAAAVASLYRDLCRHFVLDAADAVECDAVRAAVRDVIVVPTLTGAGPPDDVLARAVLGARRHEAV